MKDYERFGYLSPQFCSVLYGATRQGTGNREQAIKKLLTSDLYLLSPISSLQAKRKSSKHQDGAVQPFLSTFAVAIYSLQNVYA